MITENVPTIKKNESERLIRRVTWLGLVANLFLSVMKMIAGVFANSQVLIADSIHSLSDLGTDVAILVGSRFWGRPADQNHPNGHAKIESMITLFIGIALIIVALELIQSAILSLRGLLDDQVIPLPGRLALFVAILSILLKEGLYRITVRVGRRTDSSAVIANAWHHRSDALSSVPAALAVGVCLLFGERYTFMDPVGSIVVSCMISFSALKIMTPAITTLLDRGETEEKVGQIQRVVREFPEITGLHKIRTRPLGGGRFALDLHLEVDPEMSVKDAHSLSHRVYRAVRDQIPEFVDIVAHLEPTPEKEKAA